MRSGVGLGERAKDPEGQVANGVGRESGEERMKGGAGGDARADCVVREGNVTCSLRGWDIGPEAKGRRDVGVALGRGSGRGGALWVWLGR